MSCLLIAFLGIYVLQGRRVHNRNGGWKTHSRGYNDLGIYGGDLRCSARGANSFRHPGISIDLGRLPSFAQGDVKVREVFSGPAKWRRKQPGRRRKNRSNSVFPLMIGQSVGLDGRFGGQIASLIVGRAESRTRGGWGKSLPQAGSRERKRRIDPFESRRKRHFIGAGQAHSPKQKRCQK